MARLIPVHVPKNVRRDFHPDLLRQIILEDPQFDCGRGGSVLVLGWICDKGPGLRDNVIYGTVVCVMDSEGDMQEVASTDHSYLTSLDGRTWHVSDVDRGRYTPDLSPTP
jgi:hypothetical protein